MNREVEKITNRIKERSKPSREKYLELIKKSSDSNWTRSKLHCGNLAHGFAGCESHEKKQLAENVVPNLGIITAYNDMLSAHKPYEHYPEKIREYAKRYGSVAQVAGGVPAMCDGVTQGQEGMELSLFSRDVIALSAIIGLSHNMFDAALCLGICDKIVPGLLMGSLQFGHLPVIFVPGGPMPTGISNDEKAKIRQLYAEGKIDRAALLKGESDSYHSPGTCTFYGTANSNQMLMEMMGLQLPGSSFINPSTELRDKLTEYAVKLATENCLSKDESRRLANIIDEKAIVNGIIGLLATGGSTNHTIHLIAIAKSAGIIIDWQDFSELSDVIPLLARVYPNGAADVNHFHAAGGVPFIVKTLLSKGLLNEDVNTIVGKGLSKFACEPKINNGEINFVEGAHESHNNSILRPVEDPFMKSGGIKLLKGNIGRSVIKISAVDEKDRKVEAPAIVFETQEDFIKAFKKGELNKDFVAVLPFQGPKKNGMPELHQLTPSLTVLQKKGFKVALVTDGRMSGASGKVPAAIHVCPEAADGGPISKIRNGDIISLDSENGILQNLTTEFLLREPSKFELENTSVGQMMFNNMRKTVTQSEEGASFLI
ncbi:MAG: phosphogluconate dehydratase [Bacteroidota bacterium]|jgi:phosphogluconate dehydratase